MGHGCYYTLSSNRDIKAFWVPVEYEPDDRESEEFLNTLHYVRDELEKMDKVNIHGAGIIYYGKHHRIILDSTHNGDVLIDFVVDLEYYHDGYQVSMLNLERCYLKIIKHLNAVMPVRCASSGYTSCLYGVGELAQELKK